MRISDEKRGQFLVKVGGPQRLLISAGEIITFDKRAAYNSISLGDYPLNQDSPIPPSGFSILEVPEYNLEIAANVDSRLYLSLPILCSIKSGSNTRMIVEIGTGNGEENSEYHPLNFGSILTKEYSWRPATSPSYVVVPEDEDPDLDTHAGLKQTDTRNDGLMTYRVELYLRIADITVVEQDGDTSIRVRQRHRGPINFHLPTIYYGDYDYRNDSVYE